MWTATAALRCLTAMLAAGIPILAQPPASVPPVLLDVDVRDSKGQPVKNLKVGDLEVFEDGVKQELFRFRLSTGDRRNDASSGAKPLESFRLVCLVFHNLDMGTRKYAMDAAEELLNREMRPGTFAAIYGLDDRLTLLHPFTSEYATVLQAARRAAGLPAASTTGSSTSASVEAITVAEASAGPALLQPSSVKVEGARDIDRIRTLVEQVGRVAGRKVVILISPGLDLGASSDEVRAVTAAAVRSNVFIYGVDIMAIRELNESPGAVNLAGNIGFASPARMAGSTGDGVVQAFESSRDQSRQLNSVSDQAGASAIHAGLRTFAEGTGGFLIASKDFRRPFARIIQEMDTRYEVGYSPAAAKPDGHRRRIEVRPARAGLTVHSRTAYFALPDLGASLMPFETAALAVLSAEPRPRAFDFRAAAYRFRPGAAGSEVSLAFQVPGSALNVAEVPGENRFRFHVSAFALVKDSSGVVVDKVGQDLTAALPPDRLERLRAGGLSLAKPLKLPVGRYTIETALLDRQGNTSSTGVFTFDNAERPGLVISDVVLIDRIESAEGEPDEADPFRVENRRVIPRMNTVVEPGLQPQLFFVIYPDRARSEPVELTLQLRLEGSLISEQASELAVTEGGAIPVVAAGVSKPGKWELRVVAVQGDESAEAAATYTVVSR